jgi:hypothetical protein
MSYVAEEQCDTGLYGNSDGSGNGTYLGAGSGYGKGEGMGYRYSEDGYGYGANYGWKDGSGANDILQDQELFLF